VSYAHVVVPVLVLRFNTSKPSQKIVSDFRHGSTGAPTYPRVIAVEWFSAMRRRATRMEKINFVGL
jgi:hypothetical protein